jgi:hypothetical protein
MGLFGVARGEGKTALGVQGDIMIDLPRIICGIL